MAQSVRRAGLADARGIRQLFPAAAIRYTLGMDKERYVSAGQAAQALGVPEAEVVASIERAGLADLIGGAFAGRYWLPAWQLERVSKRKAQTG